MGESTERVEGRRGRRNHQFFLEAILQGPGWPLLPAVDGESLRGTQWFGQLRALAATAVFYPFSLVNLIAAWSEQYPLAAFSLEPNREAKSLF